MSKFKKGDKVISVMNTPYAQEGFIGTVAYINSDTRYPINVVKDDQHNSNVYAFADNELALLRTFQADEKESDAVHSPKHYAVFDDIEAIEVIARSMTQEMFKGYCFGNLLNFSYSSLYLSDFANSCITSSLPPTRRRYFKRLPKQ